MGLQLPLMPPPPVDYAYYSFVADASNQDAYDIATRWPDWPTAWSTIEGPKGSGKTHLAHIWADPQKGQKIHSTQLEAWISSTHNRVNPKLYWIDITPDFSPQTLFHALNHAKACGLSLLLLSPPSLIWQIASHLPDLHSRLKQGLYAVIQEPSEDLFPHLITKNFADLGYQLTPEALQYLGLRINRSSKALRLLHRDLEKRTAAGEISPSAPVTVPWIRKNLKLG